MNKKQPHAIVPLRSINFMIVNYVNCYLKSFQRKLADCSERCRADNCRSIPNSGQDRTLNPIASIY
jgi:hypothetical protein